MYRTSVFLYLVAAAFLDSVVFAKYNLYGICPDSMLVVIVCLGILLGSGQAAVAGCIAGLFMDILFGKAIGISAIPYMLCGLVGGIFYKKYYADNFIIPAVTVAACAFMKENMTAIIARSAGGNFSYLGMLVTYIIPSMLMSTVLCIPVHLLLKPTLHRQVKKRYERSTGGVR